LRVANNGFGRQSSREVWIESLLPINYVSAMNALCYLLLVVAQQRLVHIDHIIGTRVE
jgi:hypothetical protein